MSGAVGGPGVSLDVSPDVCLSLACYLGYAWCVAHFLKRHLRGKFSTEVIPGGFLFCGYGALALFLGRGGVPYIFYAVCHHLLLIGLVMTVFREDWAKKLLVATVLLVMTGLIGNFAESFFSCVGLFFFCGKGRGGQLAMWSIGMERILLFLTYGTQILAVHLLSKALSPVFVDKRKNWYLCLTFPLACIVLIVDVANWAASNGILVQAQEKYGLYENQFFSHGAMCIFTGLAMAAAGFLVFGMERIKREERTGEQYRCRVLYYQMLEEQFAQLERLRHDWKNHMIVLDRLVQNRQWEQTGDYLGEMARAVGVEVGRSEEGGVEVGGSGVKGVKNTGEKAGDEVTGSMAMDALLYHKRRQAMEQGIRWRCDVRMPGDCPVREMDLCIIVGNILDNAVEACCRLSKEQFPDLGFIQVHMEAVKRCLLLEVKNGTDLTDKREIGKSRKRDLGVHGIGLANVRVAVAAYNGVMQMEVEDGIFTVSVLLPLYRDDLA